MSRLSRQPLCGGPSPAEVWLRAAERYESGEGPVLSVSAKAMIEGVIGRPLLRGGRHAARPDAADRRAGDTSVGSDDDSWMEVL